MTDTIEQVEELILPYEDTGNNKLTHIVSSIGNEHYWVEGMTSQEFVDFARGAGVEVVTLCGYKFVPVQDPERFDACQACFKVAEQIMKERG